MDTPHDIELSVDFGNHIASHREIKKLLEGSAATPVNEKTNGAFDNLDPTLTTMLVSVATGVLTNSLSEVFKKLIGAAAEMKRPKAAPPPQEIHIKISVESDAVSLPLDADDEYLEKIAVAVAEQLKK